MWTLVIYIYAGMMAKGDSVALTTVPGFASVQQCEQAGRASEKLVQGSTKDVRFVCMQAAK